MALPWMPSLPFFLSHIKFINMSTFTLTLYPKYGILFYHGTPAEPKSCVLLAGRDHGRLSVLLCGSLSSPSVYNLQTNNSMDTVWETALFCSPISPHSFRTQSKPNPLLAVPHPQHHGPYHSSSTFGCDPIQCLMFFFLNNFFCLF